MVLTVWSSSSSWLFPFSSSPQEEWVHSGTILANLILLPLLMQCLDDISLIILSILTTAIASILWTGGHSYLYDLLLGPLFAFYQPIEIILNSCISKLVPENEVGTAFSFLAVLSSPDMASSTVPHYMCSLAPSFLSLPPVLASSSFSCSLFTRAGQRGSSIN